MYSGQFDYYRAKSVEEAGTLLGLWRVRRP